MSDTDSLPTIEDPEAAEAARLEVGRLLFARECRFFYAAQKLEQLPAPALPEVAFAGRSNVGKSTLINALTGRKTLARASNTPGRTRQLNFFELGERLTLVDMPGYGYAQAGKEIKARLAGLDVRLSAGSADAAAGGAAAGQPDRAEGVDHAVMDLLDRAAVTYQLVLTKADGVKPGPLARKQAEVLALSAKHAAAFPVVITTSSETGVGIDLVRADLAGLAA